MVAFGTIIRVLFNKNCAVTFRNAENLKVFFFGAVILFASVSVIWLFSYQDKTTYSTSAPYQGLQFQFRCSRSQASLPAQCTSVHDAQHEHDLTPSDLLINFLNQKYGEQKDEKDKKLLSTLTSMMMHGLPLVGLDDFVFLSDYSNKYLSANGMREKILAAPDISDQFDNFLNVRTKVLMFTPDTSCTHQLLKYLNETTHMFTKLNVQVMKNMDVAMDHCCDNVWAIVEVQPSHQHSSNASSSCEWKPQRRSSSLSANLTDPLEIIQDWSSELSNFGQVPSDVPAITIRMHPLATPDTRNYAWTPLKRNVPRQQSGQLLYFTSGFLSLQMEIQRFLASKQSMVESAESKFSVSDSFSANSSDAIYHVWKSMKDIFQDPSGSTSWDEQLRNLTAALPTTPAAVYFQMYHRAFPTQTFDKSTFWVIFGVILVPAIIVFLSLPIALVWSRYKLEDVSGHLDVLSTVPGVRRLHSALAWYLVAVLWTTMNALCIAVFCGIVVQYSQVSIPVVAVFCAGIAMISWSIVLTRYIRQADALVLAIPLVAFLTSLPALLYFDLAFDVQRSVFAELALSLLPTSGLSLILRLLFAKESIGAGVDWTTTFPNSSGNVRDVVIVLTIDAIVGLCVLFFAVEDHVNYLHSDLDSLASQIGDGKSFHPRLLAEWREYKVAQQQKEMAYQQYKNTRSPRWLRWVIDRVLCLACFPCQLWYLFTRCVSVVGRYLCRRKSATGKVYAIVNIPEAETDTDDDPFVLSFAEKLKQAQQQQQRGDGDEEDAALGLGAYARLHSPRDRPAVLKRDEVLFIHRLSKQYPQSDTPVLSHLFSTLSLRKITLLLGSNGAGKTTLMKVIAGLDEQFQGEIVLVDRKRTKSTRSGQGSAPRRRLVGWCPQDDALFPFLTVQEHLELMQDLGGASTKNKKTQIPLLLRELQLVPHAHKLVQNLSGGMKRRVTLAMALMHRPAMLIVDEPTSGCDAYTREIVRQVLLRRKKKCAILLSTHHEDDIDVLADHVWFLNEHRLEVDSSARDVVKKSLPPPSPQREEAKSDLRSRMRVRALELRVEDRVIFSTSIPQIAARFVQFSADHAVSVQPIIADTRTSDSATADQSRVQQWSVPLSAPLLDFIEQLEKEQETGWTVSHPTVFQALRSMYQQPTKLDEVDNGEQIRRSSSSDRRRRTSSAEERSSISSLSSSTAPLRETEMTPLKSYSSSASTATEESSSEYPVETAAKSTWMPLICLRWGRRIALSFQQMRAMVQTRWLELRSRGSMMLWTQLLIPWVVILIMAIACKDIRYPKITVDSVAFQGLGEVCVSVGQALTKPTRQPLPNNPHTTHSPAVSQFMMPSQNGDEEEEEQRSSAWHQVLSDYLPDVSVRFLGMKQNSDDIWTYLRDTYHAHESRRWGAVVLDDAVSHWAEVSVSTPLKDESEANQVYEALQRLHQLTCKDEANSGTHRTSVYKNHNDLQSYSPFHFCPDLEQSTTSAKLHGPGYTFKINVNTTAASNNGSYTSYELQFTQYLGLKTGLTLLSNSTTDHAAPVYLKELLPPLYDLVHRSSSSDQTMMKNSEEESVESLSRPVYTLYNYPLPETSLISKVSIERGSFSATLTLIYLLLSTVTGVRSIAALRASGTKRQWHLSGVSVWRYWTVQATVDATVVLLTFLVIWLALYLGGDPLRRFFFIDAAVVPTDNNPSLISFQFSPLTGVSFLRILIAFAGASVTSGFFTTVFSQDALINQLVMLCSTVCGPVILKLYLERHAGQTVFDTISFGLCVLSPAYAFATAVFELFALFRASLVAAGVTVYTTDRASAYSQNVLQTLSTLSTCETILWVQCVVYLVLTMLMDTYGAVLWQLCQRWYWQCTSTQNLGVVGNDEELSVRGLLTCRRRRTIPHATSYMSLASLTPSMPVLISQESFAKDKDPATEEGAADDELWSSFIEEINIQGRQLLIQRLHVPEDYTSGIFPDITYSGYHLACALHAQRDKQNIALRAPLQSASIATAAAMYSDDEKTGQVGFTAAAVAAQDLCVGPVTLPVHSSPSVVARPTGHYTIPPDSVPEHIHRLSLANLDLSWPVGDRRALLGMNGGGKTTFFETLTGLSSPAMRPIVQGQVALFGHDITVFPWQQSAAREPVGCTIAYVPQEGGALLSYLTVAQIVDLQCQMVHGQSWSSFLLSDAVFPHSQHQTNVQFQVWANLLVPEKYWRYPVSSLSGGTKKKLAVLLALLSLPRLLLLDECTTGVDPIAAATMVSCITEYLQTTSTTTTDVESGPQQSPTEQQTTIVFSSHRLDECATLCKDVSLLVDGHISLSASIHQLTEATSLLYQVDLFLPLRDDNESSRASSPPTSARDPEGETPRPSPAAVAALSAPVPRASLPRVGAPTSRSASPSAPLRDFGPPSTSSPSASPYQIPQRPVPTPQTQKRKRRKKPKKARAPRSIVNLRPFEEGKVIHDADADAAATLRRFLLAQQPVERERAGSSADDSESEGDDAVSPHHGIERWVEYSHTQWRLTLNRRHRPLSRLTKDLWSWQRRGLIDRFAFRTMDFEEAMTILLSASARPPHQS